MDPAWEARAEPDALHATFGEHGEVAALARALDWSKTPLGPVHHWSSLLRGMVRLTMASPQPVCLCWGPDAIALFNDASVPALRGRLREAFARPLFESFPGAAEYAQPVMARVLGGESVTEFGRHVPLVNDEETEDAWFDFECTPIREADGSVAGAFNVWRERTAEVLASRRQQMLTRLADALRPLGDPIEVEEVATRMLGEHLKLTRVMYGEVESDNEHVRFDRSYVAPGAPVILGRFRMRDFGDRFVSMLLAGETLIIDSIAAASELTAEEREGYAKLGIAALVGVPLVKHGRLVANISVHDANPRSWQRADVALIQETAERTWAAAERARSELALRGSEQRARALLAEATVARAEAEAANRAKDEFLATLSHELRTPLAAIHLWSGALRAGAVPLNDLTRAIDAIAQSAESLSQLIEDLLDLSRLTSGKLALARSSVDVARVARAAFETVKPLAVAKGITLSVQISGDLGFAVLDGTRLKQVLWNLLTNAVKFTPAGGSATLHIRRIDENLQLEVVDTGEGIAPEFLPHVFERFRQADMAETRRHTGLGIGLALAKQLVELHGGMITAQSDGLGRGATFRVRLPFVSHEVLGEAGVGDPLAIGVSATSPLAGLGVLLIEDDTKTQDAMRWTLEQAGATVEVVASATEALAALDRQSGNEVIVSDLGLPGMSGFELMERIVDQNRQRGRRPPPSCAVSAHVRDVDRRRAIEAGFDMYLTKPVTPERLVEAVTDLRDILGTNRI